MVPANKYSNFVKHVFYQGRVSTGNKNILLTVTNTVFKRHSEYKRKFFADSSLKKDTV